MFFALCCVVCVLFTAFWGAEKLTEKGLSGDSVEYKGIIKVWQIDSFEGGMGSRKQFLLKVARGFTRPNIFYQDF